ncbi:hypothetical protein CC78DRAFT_581682 [Lojkania enalia]|uniref:Uncharacterized protein n=1 Tax=Lojkania enalia TaxID=147567 RepID=A0A9P4N7Y6_9PLEO|nr:hypothetical protein CC78DRAFT_581682 [Didymosphaeria enalia]
MAWNFLPNFHYQFLLGLKPSKSFTSLSPAFINEYALANKEATLTVAPLGAGTLTVHGTLLTLLTLLTQSTFNLPLPSTITGPDSAEVKFFWRTDQIVKTRLLHSSLRRTWKAIPSPLFSTSSSSLVNRRHQGVERLPRIQEDVGGGGKNMGEADDFDLQADFDVTGTSCSTARMTHRKRCSRN